MTGARSRAKGAEFERTVVHLLLQWLPPGWTAIRGIQPQGARVAGVPDVRVRDPFGRDSRLWLECKCRSEGDPVTWLAEARNDCGDERWPIVIVHRPGTRYENDRAHLYLRDLLCLGGEPVAWRDDLPVSVLWSDLVTILGAWAARS